MELSSGDSSTALPDALKLHRVTSIQKVLAFRMHHLRREYDAPPIDENSLSESPFMQFEEWYQTAVKEDLLEPNAMVLSTVDDRGQPSQRTVLLKYYDTTGFVFFTNLESRKAKQIAQNSRVSLLFQWLPLQRQLAIEGAGGSRVYSGIHEVLCVPTSR